MSLSKRTTYTDVSVRCSRLSFRALAKRERVNPGDPGFVPSVIVSLTSTYSYFFELSYAATRISNLKSRSSP